MSSTLGDLTRAVAAELRRRKFPGPCVYGALRAPTRHDLVHFVIFERDREAGDSIDAAIASTPQAAENKRPFSRALAGRVTVYARSPKPGATEEDHEQEVDDVTDGVLTAMRRVCVSGKVPLAITSCRLFTAEEFNADRPNEQWPGSVARVTFNVAGPVREVDYRGVGPLTGVVDDVANDVEAELVAAPDDP